MKNNKKKKKEKNREKVWNGGGGKKSKGFFFLMMVVVKEEIKQKKMVMVSYGGGRGKVQIKGKKKVNGDGVVGSEMRQKLMAVGFRDERRDIRRRLALIPCESVYFP